MLYIFIVKGINMCNYKQEKMIISSIAERLAFIEFYAKKMDFEIIGTSAVTGYDNWDVKILSGGTKYIIEIKIRRNDKALYLQNSYHQLYKYEVLLVQYFFSA